MKKIAEPVAWSVGGIATHDKKWAERRSEEDNLLMEPLYKHPIVTGIDENHYDPELEPGLYVAEIMTKGGAAIINGYYSDENSKLLIILIKHLQNAHDFIENTEAFGHEAASGIIKCGSAEWNIDNSKQDLAICLAAVSSRLGDEVDIPDELID